MENALTRHPAVQAAAVIPVPDPRYGQAVHAVIVTVPGTHLTPDQPRHHALKELERPVYVPQTIDLVDALPLTPLGKVDKPALRAPRWEGQPSSLHGWLTPGELVRMGSPLTPGRPAHPA